MALRFHWHPAKAARNLRKHGVSFEEATTAFDDPHSVTVPDPEHSANEARFVLVGLTRRGHLVVVAHTEDGDDIRIISARGAAPLERRAYEEEG